MYEAQKKYAKLHPDKVRANIKKWLENPENRAKKAAYNKKWKQAHPNNDYFKKKYHTDPIWREEFLAKKREREKKQRQENRLLGGDFYEKTRIRKNGSNKKRGISCKLRFEVLQRDNFTCQYCGRSAPEVVLHVDHIIPFVDEKKLVYSSKELITSCVDCNIGKSNN